MTATVPAARVSNSTPDRLHFEVLPSRLPIRSDRKLKAACIERPHRQSVALIIVQMPRDAGNNFSFRQGDPATLREPWRSDRTSSHYRWTMKQFSCQRNKKMELTDQDNDEISATGGDHVSPDRVQGFGRRRIAAISAKEWIIMGMLNKTTTPRPTGHEASIRAVE